jgi:hypothetical protein
MSRVCNKKTIYSGLIIFIFLFFKGAVLASTTDGTIDPTGKYAWSENIGWINFGSAEGNVHITDTGLTGYAWTENSGWISLNCSNDASCLAVDYKVANDGNGTLSGYGYGENVGWINFNPTGGGVTINALGVFEGYAWGENTGWIMFNCSANTSCLTVDFKVKTDYIPSNARPSAATPTPNYPIGGGSSGAEYAKASFLANIKNQIILKENELARLISTLPKDIIGIFKPQEEQPEVPIVAPPIEEVVNQEAPLSLKGEWNLMSSDFANNFVLSPFPSSIQELVDKLPQLRDTFNKLGISNFSDLEKLRGIDITLARKLNEEIPKDMLFASLIGDKLQLSPILTIADNGEIKQKISAFPGKALTLTIKPEHPVRQITGYVAFKSENPTGLKNTKSGLAKILSNMTASLLSLVNSARNTENVFIVSQFQYTDPNNDGIYTADVAAPSTVGIYQIVSELSYADSSIENKEIKLTLVIDPEGYVFYKTKTGDEARIKNAKVFIMSFNPSNSQYELWKASDFSQTNPQTTDNTGRYSFLVPEGKYYLKVESSNYSDYSGDAFEVKEGAGIHQNIELKPKYWWVGFFDPDIILLSVIAVLLAVIIILIIFKKRQTL